MVKVDWLEDPDGTVWSVQCSGHAGLHQDLDLVCAAVSALTGALGLGFTQVLSLPSKVQAGHGHFLVQLDAQQRSHEDFVAAQVLLRTVVLALTEMMQHYPGFIQRKPGKKKVRHE